LILLPLFLKPPVELPRGIRINCISPTVLAESEAYHAYFTGFTTVPAAEVAKERTCARCRRRSPDASSGCTRPIADHDVNDRQGMRDLTASIDSSLRSTGDSTQLLAQPVAASSSAA
jgi:hypothetical protein